LWRRENCWPYHDSNPDLCIQSPYRLHCPSTVISNMNFKSSLGLLARFDLVAVVLVQNGGNALPLVLQAFIVTLIWHSASKR
jgi:hypothetical protein